MSDQTEPSSPSSISAESESKPVRSDPTDRPIPIFPEGLLVVAAGVTLLVIALKHRSWLQRKATQAQSAWTEFQRHGGLDDLKEVAAQAAQVFQK